MFDIVTPSQHVSDTPEVVDALMAKNIDNYADSVLKGVIERSRAGDHVSDLEREAIIKDIIASQRIEGIDVSYEMVAEVVDQVLSEPLPTLN